MPPVYDRYAGAARPESAGITRDGRLSLHFAGPMLHGHGGTVQTGGGVEGGPLAGCKGENRERGCCVICSAIPADVHLSGMVISTITSLGNSLERTCI